MRIAALASLAACGLLCLGQASAVAQVPFSNPYRRPVTSPYLYLLNPGASPDANYFGLTKPLIDTRRNAAVQAQQLQSLQRQTQAQKQQLDKIRNAEIGATGHSIRFMDYGGYYNFQSSGRLGRR